MIEGYFNFYVLPTVTTNECVAMTTNLSRPLNPLKTLTSIVKLINFNLNRFSNFFHFKHHLITLLLVLWILTDLIDNDGINIYENVFRFVFW